MWKATIKGVLAHKVRLALTALSVMLGVAFVSGTLVLTDTMNHTFDVLFAETQAGVDVSVRARSGFDDGGVGGGGGNAEVARATVPESLLAQVRSADGVRVAEGGVGGFAQLVKPDGKAVTTTGAPTLGFSWTRTLELSPLRLRSGRAPEAEGEVVIDAVTARDHDLDVGAQVKVLSRAGSDPFRVVGVAGFGEADSLAGATLAVFELATAQRLFDKVGGFDTIDIAAADGVGPGELQRQLASSLPPSVEVLTGDEVAQESADQVKQGLAFFSIFLLTFAGISVFVGAFIIFNTFSILVAQRTRELGLLRALGASRRQVMASVITESLVVGTLASVVGLLAGLGVAVALQALLKVFGLDLPTTTTQFLPRTVVVSLLVGITVTVVAAIPPARRAARISPIAALRQGLGDEGGSLRRRTVYGSAVAGLGAAALGIGLFGGAGIALVGAGTALTFVGVAMLSPLVARPLAAAIGAPMARVGRLPSRLGRQNAMRNPRRTATTAAALMVGLGLVGCVTVLSASIKQSAREIFDRSLTADFALSTEVFFPTISPEVAQRVSALPEVGAATGLKTGEVRVEGSSRQMTGADPAALAQVLTVEMVDGDYGALARGDLLVDEDQAEARGWAVSQTVTVQFARTGNQQFRLGGVFANNELIDPYLVSTRVYDANFTEALDFIVLASVADGVPAERARQAIEGVTAEFPNLEVRNQSEVLDAQERQVNQLLALVNALLSLAIVIALMGIVNTLALSVFERTRELGLLRAVGMARRQVRSMIRVEAVIISVLGALLGLALGTLFGWAIVSALADDGVTSLVVPAGSLLSWVLIAAVAGVLVAVSPARRAARLDVLAAITYE